MLVLSIKSKIYFVLTFSPDIYLLDDPVSALDGNVGEYLMEKSISIDLKDKTRVLVTHAVHFLKYADHIILMDKGEIKFAGNYEQLKNHEVFKAIMERKANKSKKEEEEEAKKEQENAG